MRILSALLIVSLGMGWVFAQAPGGTFRVDRETILLNVLVADVEGKPLTDLTQEDFGVYEDGELRPIRTFESVDKPWSFLLLFDHSRTWLQAIELSEPVSQRNAVIDVWRSLGQAITGFIASLSPDDRIAAAVFEDTVVKLLDWRDVRNGRTQTIALNQLLDAPRGQKDLYGALTWAAKELKGVSSRKAVILFTDGRDGRLSPRWFEGTGGRQVIDPLFGAIDDGEELDFRKTLDTVRKSGIPFYFISVDPDRYPVFMRPGGREYRLSSLYPGTAAAEADYLSRVKLRMQHIATDSGGSVYLSQKHEDTLALVAQLHRALGVGLTYTLGFTPAAPIDGAFHRIEVRVRDRDARVGQSRNGYFSR